MNLKNFSASNALKKSFLGLMQFRSNIVFNEFKPLLLLLRRVKLLLCPWQVKLLLCFWRVKLLPCPLLVKLLLCPWQVELLLCPWQVKLLQCPGVGGVVVSRYPENHGVPNPARIWDFKKTNSLQIKNIFLVPRSSRFSVVSHMINLILYSIEIKFIDKINNNHFLLNKIFIKYNDDSLSGLKIGCYSPLQNNNHHLIPRNSRFSRSYYEF